MPQRRRDLIRAAAGLTAAGVLPRRAAAEPSPGARRPPNILFFFPDQQRFDWAPHNGSLPLPMPNLAALAARGLTLTRAFTPSPACAPARAAVVSGREFDRCGVRGNGDDYPLDQPTYFAMLRDAGYHVLACGKLDLHKDSYIWGLDGRGRMREWGLTDMIDNSGKGDGFSSYLTAEPKGTAKDPYYAYLDSLDPPLGAFVANELSARRAAFDTRWWGDTTPIDIDDAHYCDNWLARNGLELLGRVPRGEPWHLVVNFVGPHPSMDITRAMERRYRGPDRLVDGFPQPAGYQGPFPPEQHQRIRQNYAAMIENIDAWLGRYLEAVAARGELDDTVVVYSSDHGEMLGDRGLWGKSVPFQPSVSVPLVVAGAGVAARGTYAGPASLVDLAATFVELAGGQPAADWDSRSLVPLLGGATRSHRDAAFTGLGSFRAVADARHKFVRGYRGRDWLFDLDEDPLKQRNLVDAAPDVARRLAGLLPVLPARS
jgi:choline-sulfatase